MTQLSRRRVLIAGLAGAGLLAAGAVGVEEGVLPGRSRLYAGLGLNGTGTTLPQATPGPQVHGQFNSRHRGVRVGWTIAYPPSSRVGNPLPVVVGLHGRYDDHTALFGERIGLDRFLAANPQPFAIAAVDGGDTYWHRRASGEDAGAMVVDEFLPLLAEHGLQTARIGLYGYSMGGYGALRLAGVLGHDRVAAVAAISAALWKRPATPQQERLTTPQTSPPTLSSATSTTYAISPFESIAAEGTALPPPTGATALASTTNPQAGSNQAPTMTATGDA